MAIEWYYRLGVKLFYIVGAAIEASLKQLAERRTDIFGVGDEETAIGKKIGEEDTRKDDKVTWDGHTSSVEAATRAARANITLEDQVFDSAFYFLLYLCNFMNANTKVSYTQPWRALKKVKYLKERNGLITRFFFKFIFYF